MGEGYRKAAAKIPAMQNGIALEKTANFAGRTAAKRASEEYDVEISATLVESARKKKGPFARSTT